jgi:hypothetical protein
VSAEQPCVVCGIPTTDRHGTVAWMRDMPRCADREACRARRKDKRRAREQRRLHPPRPTERDIERGRQLAEEMGW